LRRLQEFLASHPQNFRETLNLPHQINEVESALSDIIALGEAGFIDCIPAKKVTAAGKIFG
jgi:deoxyribodipyrimidine photolyase